MREKQSKFLNVVLAAVLFVFTINFAGCGGGIDLFGKDTSDSSDEIVDDNTPLLTTLTAESLVLAEAPSLKMES